MITLDDINRVTMRRVFLPWFKTQASELGFKLPTDWNPSDEELIKLSNAFAEACRNEGLFEDVDG